MRAPFQILVIPFRRMAAEPEFAVLTRSDAGWCQFVAGGGEDRESPEEAAARETQEEIGINAAGALLALDSTATVPKDCFAAAASWSPDVYVIPEYCFAVDVGDRGITLSGEHTALQWVSYKEAAGLLKWDSNRNALWELNERLKRQNCTKSPNPNLPFVKGVPGLAGEGFFPKGDGCDPQPGDGARARALDGLPLGGWLCQSRQRRERCQRDLGYDEGNFFEQF